MKAHRARRTRGVRGQSSVEFALVVPLLAIALLVAVQVGLVVTTKLAVTHTAREAARALSIDPDADLGHLAEVVHPTGEQRTITVRWKPAPMIDGRLVEVRVEQEVPRLVGPWTPSLRVAATVTMLSER